MPYNGRREILLDVDAIDETNIIRVLDDAMKIHQQNRAEIQYLYDYYRGITPVYNKVKDVRPEINNKVNVNRAYEIISFKLGYAYGEPIAYVTREGSSVEEIGKLNDMMMLANKTQRDTELAQWCLISGVGYRIAFPSLIKDESKPFDVYTPYPGNTFIIKRNDIRKTKLAGVTYVEHSDKSRTFSVYTDTKYFVIKNERIDSVEDNIIGIPIIEYVNNDSRLGAFEPVLPLLDAISAVESSRVDDIEQTVNSFLAIVGGTIDEQTIETLQRDKILCAPDGVDIKYLSKPMQQSDIQVLVNSMYQTVLTIVGMPNRNGGSSTSDTGRASELRDGWSSANNQAKISELFFKSSEREFLRLVLDICRTDGALDLDSNMIEIKFTRHNTEDMTTKTSALAAMINSGISPKVAIATSELWNDPNDVYEESRPYLEKAESAEETVIDESVV